MARPEKPKVTPQQIQNAHTLYCRLTGQKLPLRFDRERMWYELLREGYTLSDIRKVITYLQNEIRNGRRNLGALKLSNLLQPDRFDEDYNLTRIKLSPPSSPKSQAQKPIPKVDPQEQERRRQHALKELQQLRQELNLPPRDSNLSDGDTANK